MRNYKVVIVIMMVLGLFSTSFFGFSFNARADPGAADAGNTLSEATQISPGTYTGSLSASDTNDYYKFSVSSGKKITITMGYPSGQASCDFDIKLYNPQGVEKASSYAGANQQEKIEYNADVSGYWVLRVYRYSGAGNYTFTIALSGTTTAQDNTPPSIAIVSPNTATVKGYVDIVATVTDDSSIQSVSYKIGSGSYRSMTLDSGRYYASWDSSTVSDGQKTITVRAQDSAGNYGYASLSVNVSNAGSASVVSDANLGVDAGNTISTASLITPGMNMQGYLSSTDKYDYYKFQVNKNDTISATMSPPSGADYDLKLYTPSGTQKARSSNPVGQPESLTFTATSSGNWVLKVERVSGTGYYSFGISVYAAQRDSQKPSITIVSPTSDEKVTGELTIRATVSDDIGVAAVKYKIGTSGTLQIMNFMRTGYYEAKVNTGSLGGDGAKWLYVYAYDTSGNSDSKSIRFYVQNTRVAKWSVMILDAVDNDLHSCRSDIEKYGSTQDVNFIHLEDLNGTNNSRLWYVGRYTSTVLQELGEVNTGDPNTLKLLIDYTKEHFPANNYALIISGHGGGMGGIAFDSTNGRDRLTMAEIKSVLSNSGIRIKVFGLDSCVQGVFEIVYEYRNYVDYIVASQDFDTGFAYTSIAKDLTQHPDWTPADFAKDIVDTYHYSRGSSTSTMAAYDMSKADALKSKLATLSTKLNNAVSAGGNVKNEILTARNKTQANHEWTSYVDIYDMAYQLKIYVSDSGIKTAAQDVMDAINSFVIKNRVSSWGQMKNAHGIAIYYQVNGTQCGNWFRPTGNYQTLESEFLSATMWNEFVMAVNT
ncbi:MAG: clostripain-related cysteine peptidase [Thermoplasmata archaeon]